MAAGLQVVWHKTRDAVRYRPVSTHQSTSVFLSSSDSVLDKYPISIDSSVPSPRAGISANWIEVNTLLVDNPQRISSRAISLRFKSIRDPITQGNPNANPNAAHSIFG